MRKTTAIAALALAAAGCGSTAPPANTGGSGRPGPSGAYAYARCIRQHGVPSFPDPVVHTTAGSTSVRQMLPASVAGTPAFKSAQKTCAPLQPGPGTAGPDHQGPPKPAILAFARCLRAHGVSGFPDPTAQGRLSQAMISGAGVDIHTQAFFAAARGCVGVTHGAITVAEVAALIHHTR